jgi:hypothetical protein
MVVTTITIITTITTITIIIKSFQQIAYFTI